MIWLLLSLALAEPIVQGDAPILSADVGDVVTMDHLSYVLREPVYDDFLVGKKNLGTCEAALEATTQQCLPALGRVEAALLAANDQFDSDEKLIDEMKDQIWQSELKLERAKNQRNNAVLVAGALVLGNCAAIAVAVAL